MSTVSILVKVPASEYRMLTGIAGPRGVQVHTLIEQLVHHALSKPEPRPGRTSGKKKSPELLEGVRSLHSQGLNDRQMAEALGVNQERARTYRVWLGLPANDPRGAKSKKTTTQESEAI